MKFIRDLLQRRRNRAASSFLSPTTRLRFSSRYAIASARNKPVLFEFAAPHKSFHISEEMRLLLSCFPYDGYLSVEEGVQKFFRIYGWGITLARLVSELADMVRIGVLVQTGDLVPGYTPDMVVSYARSRPIPSLICDTVVSDSLLNSGHSLLDIGTGAGSLAIQIAKSSTAKVTSIDISDEFLSLARSKGQGLPVEFVNRDANQLLFLTMAYDVVVASQSFHWLDSAWAARGVCHVLKRDGIFFAIESKALLPIEHPLRRTLGFGAEDGVSILEECKRHIRWYTGLFTALPVLGSTLMPMRSWIFREARSFDVDFARAYFFGDTMKREVPGTKQQSLEEALQNSTHECLSGQFYWLVVKFVKKDLGSKVEDHSLDQCTVTEI